MAHDVLIAGALFPDVPSVQFPDSQQQWHSFTDVSDTTAAAADVAQGKQFYDAQGTLTQGTASGGGGDDGSYKTAIERSGNIASFPSDLTKVGDYAFYECAVTFPASLPNGVTSIGQRAFYNCPNLAFTSLPSSLASIETNAFAECPNLAIASLPDGLTTIKSYAFLNCHNITITRLPSGVDAVAANIFQNCTSIRSIRSDGLVSSFSNYAFSGCSALTRADFPNATAPSLRQTFGSSTASAACQKLEIADMGSVQSIAANAFANCYKLSTLVLRRSDAICTLSNVSGFLNTPMRGYSGRTGTIYVPSALISTYKTASNWSTIFNEGYLTFAAIEGSAWEL